MEDLEKNSGDKLSRKEKKALSERKKLKPNETATNSASQVKRNKRKRRKTNIDLLNLKGLMQPFTFYVNETIFLLFYFQILLNLVNESMNRQN